jgi:hypothetical protein
MLPQQVVMQLILIAHDGLKATNSAEKFDCMSRQAGLKATGPGTQLDMSITQGVSTPNQIGLNLVSA